MGSSTGLFDVVKVLGDLVADDENDERLRETLRVLLGLVVATRWPPKNSICNNNFGGLCFARTIAAVRSRFKVPLHELRHNAETGR
jgi:hypothetical protein